MINTYLSVLQDAVNTMTDHMENIVKSISDAIALSLLTFQKNKELARIMLIGSVGLNPHFEEKRATDHQKISHIFEKIFGELSEKGAINIPGAKIAALLFTGSIYNTITDWLLEDTPLNLVEFAFPLVVYNLHALEIKFDDSALKNYLDELLKG
jgi:hypothetical protein